MTSSAAPISIDIVSDVMCPWCYIGKRRLEAALAMVPDLPVLVRWHPYQLDETLPLEGKDRRRYLLDKFGPDRIDTIHDRIEQIGAEENIDFAFDKIEVCPNTLDAHRLILWAKAEGKQTEMVERLFQAFFVKGEDLTKAETLISIAKEVGLEEDLVEQLLDTDSDVEKTRKQISKARQIGVTGVPFFVIDGRFAVAGAEAAETLAAALRHAEETRPGDGTQAPPSPL
ncbi:DsbA family oxidoreductase [Roseibium litorale]|uniref:DsbA family oxidoreductase n=1 Tax=Roseibium litorale TaxID=2803841 RepID=A0ABR9CJE8_9HYPH|nr:DsbA family oxidoreductase [Roseibium litorale]MBD8890863.1 DsbA family oxidoreductase [Roseibium litorale]